MEKNIYLVALFFIGLSLGVFLAIGALPVPENVRAMFAGIFVEKINPENLRTEYNASKNAPYARKIKILIVPGHDENSIGASYKDLREADLTAELGEELHSLFKNDKHYEVTLLRGRNGYNIDFLEYLSKNREDIVSFRNQKRKKMREYITNGLVDKVDNVSHVKASEETSIRLYGLNKWIDEQGISIVINIHFNDFPRKNQRVPGEYSGFAVYVPDEQYGNSRTSRQIAEKILSRFSKYYFVSTYPPESGGIVPDQDLISLGANDTLGAASILIEYGYLYEPQFKYPETRNMIMKDMALKTFAGIGDFFGEPILIRDTAILPYVWNEDLKTGDEGRGAILALQTALLESGFYPPAGKSRDQCPLTGSFKSCTKESLSFFQKKHEIISDGTQLGPNTRGVLNRLFGS